MGSHWFPAICLMLTVSFIPMESLGARPDLLGALNFSLYPTPCPANEMTLRDLSGSQVNLAALRGKVIILNFWKIDCIPCAAEKAILERMYRKYAARGLAVLSVNLFDNHERMRNYLGSGGYSFTFAYDPDKRYSAQTQALGSGVPTCFVINSNAEAIYEIPVVPTTYVINRHGQIIGRSFGMINWEQGPFVDLLESLLGSPTQVLAQANPHRTVPPQPTPMTGQTEYSRPQTPQRDEPTTGVTQPVPSGPVTARFLPFQGARPPAAAATDPARAASSSRAKVSKRPEAPVSRQDTSTRMVGQKSGSARLGDVSAEPYASQGRSRPSPLHQPTRAPQPVSQGSPHQRTAYRADPPLPATSAAPSTAAAPPMPPTTLPPAVPYSSYGTRSSVSTSTPGGASRAQRPAPPVEADGDGYVMAKVPGMPRSQGTERPSVRPAPGAGQPAPAVIPVERQDSFNRLVLDSFASPQAQPVSPQAVLPPRSSGQSDSSLFGQLNKIRTGIRDAITRPLSGK